MLPKAEVQLKYCVYAAVVAAGAGAVLPCQSRYFARYSFVVGFAIACAADIWRLRTYLFLGLVCGFDGFADSLRVAAAAAAAASHNYSSLVLPLTAFQFLVPVLDPSLMLNPLRTRLQMQVPLLAGEFRCL